MPLGEKNGGFGLISTHLNKQEIFALQRKSSVFFYRTRTTRACLITEAVRRVNLNPNDDALIFI
jgi:hypothetical protein